MKKIRLAKLTLNGYFNYGNLLQSYALQQILRRYAECVDTIWHTTDNFMPSTWGKWTWKEPIKWLLNRNSFRSDMVSGRIGWEMVRQGKIKDWADRYLQIRVERDDLSEIEREYDFFVVGSDQVWNPYFGDLSTNFLQFAPKGKRISYAASIACSTIPSELQDTYHQGLLGMRSISMREQDGADIVRRLTRRDVSVHIDPTLYLSSDAWDGVSRIPSWYHGKPYLLTYFLGPMPKEVRRIADALNLPLVNLLDPKVYAHYVTGVDEFIWAVKHAELIYTDSFHGTVFSIIYRRPFVVCDRLPMSPKDLAGGKMSSRIDTVLHYFHLERRRGTKENTYAVDDPLYVDYAGAEDVFIRERARVDQYFEKEFAEKDDL